MVPKLHAKGSSFKGAAAYVLHDKDRAESSDRVGFAETRNLAVDDPDMGWRIMAATAMDQDRLKAQAGVKNTGRKSNKHVLHLTLNWHPEQEPTREEMLDAAEQALKALGADQHQALLVSHTDEEHPHLHVLVNRVSPIDGRHLPSSKEKLKLSEWAQAYEEKTGIYCENRIVNNAHRERGEYVRGEKDQVRHIFEAQRANISNDNDRDASVIAAQKAKDHALALRGRNMAKTHAGAWERLESAYRERKAALARQQAREVRSARASVIEQMRPEWREFHRKQAKDRQDFETFEETFWGRTSNMVRTVRLSRELITESHSGIIRRTFGILSNAGKRREYFEKAQEREKRTLERRQADKITEAARYLGMGFKAKLAALRGAFIKERSELQAQQRADRNRLKENWKARTSERTTAFEARAKKRDQAQALLDRYDTAATPKRDDSAKRKQGLLSKYGASFKGAARPKASEQDNKRDDDESNER